MGGDTDGENDQGGQEWGSEEGGFEDGGHPDGGRTWRGDGRLRLGISDETTSQSMRESQSSESGTWPVGRKARCSLASEPFGYRGNG
jgi:hypothetical protein